MGNPLLTPATTRRAVWRTFLLLIGASAVAFAAPGNARGDDEPALVKTSLEIRISQRSTYQPPGGAKEEYHTTSWVPEAKFKVRGPVGAGGQFSVDFTHPDGSVWLHYDIPTDEVAANHTASLETPDGRDVGAFDSKFAIGVGTFGFSIHLNNALSGQNVVLYSGKFHVGKVSESLGIAQMKNMYNFYVDHDWALPIGYIWFDHNNDADTPPLRVSMWFRGKTTGASLEGHLFYQGKQIASTTDTGGDMDSETEATTVTDSDGDPRWVLWEFGWNFVREKSSDSYNQAFFLDKHPGDYEVKVLRDGALSRDMKFTVGDDGKVVDTGIGDANKMGTTRIIVPVKVVGTADGPAKAAAWQTDAFYGNPLTGFTAP